MAIKVLAINPWIHDFAAYDMWARPLGLLYVASALRRLGCKVRLIDALDRHHPGLPKRGAGRPRHDDYGCGKFASERIPKPAVFSRVARHWRRYGVPPDVFAQELDAVEKPDLILVTSVMTYWYPGVFEAIRLARRRFPSAPILLGGIYATLCYEHALEKSGANGVIRSDCLNQVVREIQKWCDLNVTGLDWPMEQPPLPAYDLLSNRAALAMLTGLGCPFKCTYCASRVLQPRIIRFPVDYVAKELVGYSTQYKTEDVALYDDALLVDSESHFEPILDELTRLKTGVRFHTPNGLHPKYLSSRLAVKMRRANFVSLRLSFESVAPERIRDSSNKVNTEQLSAAVENCRYAGFSPEDIAVYALAGLPGQEREEVEATMWTIHKMGVLISLSYFSPIPKTVDYKRWLDRTGADPGEPLLHNNTAQPYLFKEKLGPDDYDYLSALKTRLNRKVVARGRPATS